MPPQQSILASVDSSNGRIIQKNSSIKLPSLRRTSSNDNNNISRGRRKDNRITSKRNGTKSSKPYLVPTSSSLVSGRRKNILKEENHDSGNLESSTFTTNVTTSDAAVAPPTELSSALDANGIAPYIGMASTAASLPPFGMYGGPALPPLSGMSPYGMGMGMGMGMGGMGGEVPYFSSIYQIMYGVQNLIFSVSQIIQVVGTNQQALHHAWESLNQLIDHAIEKFNEMRVLESIHQREHETEEEKRKRKRLKVIRYAIVFGGSWLAYKLIRTNLLFSRKRRIKSTSSMRKQAYSTAAADAAMSSLGYPAYNFQGG